MLLSKPYRTYRKPKAIGSNKNTIASKVCSYFIENGSTEVQSNSRKYRTFTVPHSTDRFYFVGRNGAIRKGTCASKSFSISDSALKFLKEKGVV